MGGGSVYGNENMKLVGYGIMERVERERKRKVDDGKKRRGSRACP